MIMSELHLTLHPGVYEGESELLTFFVVTSHVLTKVSILFLHFLCLPFSFFLFFFNSLGAQHDSAGNPCADVKNIMSTRASGKETAFEWSSCSRRSIHAFLS